MLQCLEFKFSRALQISKLISTVVVFSDEGLYRCMVENEYGHASTLGTVTVEAVREKYQVPTDDEGLAPKFVKDLDDQYISEGISIELDCKVGYYCLHFSRIAKSTPSSDHWHSTACRQVVQRRSSNLRYPPLLDSVEW